MPSKTGRIIRESRKERTTRWPSASMTGSGVCVCSSVTGQGTFWGARSSEIGRVSAHTYFLNGICECFFSYVIDGFIAKLNINFLFNDRYNIIIINSLSRFCSVFSQIISWFSPEIVLACPGAAGILLNRRQKTECRDHTSPSASLLLHIPDNIIKWLKRLQIPFYGVRPGWLRLPCDRSPHHFSIWQSITKWKHSSRPFKSNCTSQTPNMILQLYTRNLPLFPYNRYTFHQSNICGWPGKNLLRSHFWKTLWR